MNRKTLGIILLIVFLLVGAVYFYYEYFLKGQLETIETYSIKIEQKKIALNELKKIKHKKEIMVKEISDLKKEEERLRTAIPDYDYTTEFNLELYNILKQQGLEVKNATPKDKKKTENYTFQNMNITIKGKKQDIIHFIKYLKQYDRTIKIEQARVSIVNVDEIEVILTIQIFFVDE